MSNDIREWLIDLDGTSRKEQEQLVRLLVQHGEPVEDYIKSGAYFNSDCRWSLLFFNEDKWVWMFTDISDYSEAAYEDQFYDYYNVKAERLRERLSTRKKVGGI